MLSIVFINTKFKPLMNNYDNEVFIKYKDHYHILITNKSDMNLYIQMIHEKADLDTKFFLKPGEQVISEKIKMNTIDECIKVFCFRDNPLYEFEKVSMTKIPIFSTNKYLNKYNTNINSDDYHYMSTFSIDLLTKLK